MTAKAEWRVALAEPIVSLPELEEHLLKRRGVTSTVHRQAFFEPNYQRDIHDPFLLTDMAAAVERVFKASEHREKVLVYGDYDADGVSSTAILVSALQTLGIDVSPFIPDRHSHGYGLYQPVLAEVAADVSLVITVDCGITATDEVAWLKKRSIDTIIIDHHTPPETLPAAVAIIHPNHPAGSYPEKNLCGAGTAWKVACALLTDARSPVADDTDQPKWLLDYAAIGTIADMVPLQGENRTIAQFGLEIMRRTTRPGVRELVRAATKTPARLTGTDVSWRIVSKLNAAGRIDHAQPALELLLAEGEERAQTLLTKINTLNQQRQTATKKIMQEAEEQIVDQDNGIVFAYNPKWPAGVVGLAANTLAKRFSKPAFVVGAAGEHAVGSVRSPATHNVLHLLKAGEATLLKFGGHRQAAGFTLAHERVADLKGLLAAAANEAAGTAVEPIEADCTLAPEIISMDLAQWLGQFEPFGEGNEIPQFLLRNIPLAQARPVGKTGEHMKYVFRLNEEPVGGIGFGLAHTVDEVRVGQRVDIITRIEENEFRGRRELQLGVQAIAPAGTIAIQ